MNVQLHYISTITSLLLITTLKYALVLPPPTALHVVAIDLPGHGRSSHRPPGAFYHIQNYIADVKYVIDGECGHITIQALGCSVCYYLALKWKKFSFLAHSMGEPLASTLLYMLTVIAYNNALHV